MAEDTTQTVVQTDVQAPPASEVTSARDTTDDLDSLLSQYDQQAKPPQTQPEPKQDTTDLQALTAKVSRLEEQTANVTFRRDMDTAIKNVRGEMDPEVFDDAFVEAFLDAQARQDPRLQAAWRDRHSNPKQYDRVLAGLGKNFSKKFSKLIDKNATEDREVVAAAVRGASTQAPQDKPPKFGEMTDREFEAERKKLYGY